MNRGFGDGMSRAFELAVTPLVFGAIGFGLDRALDTSPVFTVGLAVFAVIGMMIRLWFGYDVEMREHEASSAWNRSGAAEPTPAPTPEELADVDLWASTAEADA